MSKKKMKKRGKSAKIIKKNNTLWITIVIYIIIMGVDEQ